MVDVVVVVERVVTGAATGASVVRSMVVVRLTVSGGELPQPATNRTGATRPVSATTRGIIV
jgi:hypothetical protein